MQTAPPPRWGGSGLLFSGTSNRLAYTNQPECVGVHLIASARLDVNLPASGSVYYKLAGGPAAIFYVRLSPAGVQLRAYNGSNFTVINAPDRPFVRNAWYIWEMRATPLAAGSGTAVDLIHNGERVYSQTVVGTTFPILHIGRPASQPFQPWTGEIDEIASVLLDPDKTASSPEPAVVLQRQYLAQTRGITLA